MFDPKDFFKVSKNLYDAANVGGCETLTSSNCEEALLRTIAGRAYYSVYLTCREWLRKQFGVDVNKEAKRREKSVHTTLIELMLEYTRKQYLVDFIGELKRFREMSDYELGIKIEKDDAQRCILLAEDILNEIK